MNCLRSGWKKRFSLTGGLILKSWITFTGRAKQVDISGKKLRASTPGANVSRRGERISKFKGNWLRVQKKSYRPPMEAILLKNGGKALKSTSRQDPRAAHQSLADTPKKADRLLQTVSLLWNFAALELDWPLGENPAKGIKHFGKQREFEPWPEWMVEALNEAPFRVKVLANLILGRGQRPGSAVAMRRDQFRGECMVVRDEKGKQELEVYCPRELRRFVEDILVEGQHLLSKNLTKPMTYHAIEKDFSAWRLSLGRDAKNFSLHGLRKLSIIRLAEAGASDAEIQAVTGQSAEMVAYYRKGANRRMFSKSGQERRE